jgi:predicted dehydrogenase
VHVADLLRAVVGDEIESVAATTCVEDGIDVDAQVLTRFASGAIGSFHVSWISRPGPDHQLTLVGAGGTLHLDSRTPLTLLRDGRDAERVALPAVVSNPFEQLVRAVAGEATQLGASDGRASLAVVLAAYRAAVEGRFVEVDRGSP